MRNTRILTGNFGLEEADFEHIRSLSDDLLKHRDEFVEAFNRYLKDHFSIPENISEAMADPHRDLLGQWFDRFFAATMNNEFIGFLKRVGKAHAEMRIEQDLTAAMFAFCRSWLHQKIFEHIDDDMQRKKILLSVHRFLDLNVHVITDSAFAESAPRSRAMISLRGLTVDLSERFSTFMHAVLVVILIGLTIGALVLFGYDLYDMYTADDHTSRLLISSLGSLLIIWVLVELLHTETQMIRGGKFKISVFIGVALIAFIRDLLIITLRHDKIDTGTYFVLASTLVLGVIYWLTSRSERAETRNARSSKS